jgi:DNA-binding GntR family transcriptional regulator
MHSEVTLEWIASRASGSTSAPYYIAGVLREAIYRGILPEGKPLHQSQLAQRLSVSPIPLREALRILETEGLVAFDGYKGAVVTVLTVDEARELYEMILALESNLMRVAFPGITKRIIDEAERVLCEMEREDDCIRWRDLNQDFHNLFYESTERPLTIEMLIRLRQKTDRYIRIHLESMRGESERQHRAILEAIRTEDLEEAIRALQNHLTYTSHDLQLCMKQEQSVKKKTPPRE